MTSGYASSGPGGDQTLTLDSSQNVNRDASSPVDAEDNSNMSNQYTQIESDEVQLLPNDCVE